MIGVSTATLGGQSSPVVYMAITTRRPTKHNPAFRSLACTEISIHREALLLPDGTSDCERRRSPRGEHRRTI